jgi:hypothetical protein
MRATLYTLLAMAGFACAGKVWAGMENLPSGAYITTVESDGESVEFLPIDETGTAVKNSTPFVFHAVEEDDTEKSNTTATLEKRQNQFVGCHGPPLDHPSTDMALIHLKIWAGRGTNLCSSKTRNIYVTFMDNNVFSYYCINQYDKCGNLDIADVDEAMRTMDRYCGKYVGGWYNWLGSPEIVGKAQVGTRVCLGW